jgi:hypothetical protein
LKKKHPSSPGNHPQFHQPASSPWKPDCHSAEAFARARRILASPAAVFAFTACGSLVAPASAQVTNTVPTEITTPLMNGAMTPIENESPTASTADVATVPSRYATSGQTATPSIGAPAFTAALPVASQSDLLENPLQLGPFILRPHADYAFTYGTGINFTPGNRGLTAMHSLSPGLAVASKHLTLDYTPNLVYYSKGNFEDTVNHSANLAANFGYNDWSFQISQSYVKSSSALIETAQQTPTESFSTLLSARYEYSRKTSFDFGVTQVFQSAEGQDLSNFRQWSTMDWINYKLGSQTSIGAGLGTGFTDVEKGTDMSYEQIQGRFDWHPTQRTSLGLNGGIEIRQFLRSETSDRISPLMGASLSWSPLAHTTLGLQANSSVSTSLLQDQITQDSSISASLNQRLLKRLNLGLTGGFRTTDYIGESDAASTSRSDDLSFFSISLGTTLFKKGNISVAYQHSVNDSTLADFTYDSDQYTFQVGYHF